MNPNCLKDLVNEFRPGSHFFDKQTMQHFGDSMKNYGVRETIATMNDGTKRAVLELYRRKPVNNGLQDSAYFDDATYELLYNVASVPARKTK